ncbi:class I SAM-dependent methyltransferase [Clostridium cuniculi]|uniref:class I SAM-dependent methyltransferase n=1 Tax=Clostridium cuniculi TaxID=2548455 RepID=UPI001056E0F3|nr:class I SAM-dependent methyltransferase [Clostridium cuniculi]
MESTQKFNGLADVYTLGRPGYANELIDYLYLQHGFSDQSVIADIGSGTGKFSKLLLDKGSAVYCVEPNNDMRNKAIKELFKYKKFHSINGTATETTLDESSVDFITVAQAFHWFNVPLFKEECKRILKEDGRVFLIWNLRDTCSEINLHSFEIFSKYCPNFKGFSGGIEKDDVRIKEFFNEKYNYVEFDNPILYTTQDIFINRCLSSSYSLKEGDKNYQKYLEELSKLYDKHVDNNILTMPNKTVAYFGMLK